MKALFSAATLLWLAVTAGAVPLPRRINFQGRLTDPVTHLPKNGTFSMTFNIYGAATGGTPLYTETQPNVPVNNGVFSVQIGSVTGLSADLFADATAYLGITVAPDAEMTPRQLLAMSPYAFTAMELVQNGDIRVNAGVAYSTFSADGNLRVDNGVVADSATITGGLTASSGTFTTALGVGGTSAHAVVPSGALVLFNGACPAGWTEFTGARGLYIVGVPSGGTVGGTVGTPMADLDNSSHSHNITSTAGQARSGTGQAVIASLTTPTDVVARGTVAPYVQLRLCAVP